MRTCFESSTHSNVSRDSTVPCTAWCSQSCADDAFECVVVSGMRSYVIASNQLATKLLFILLMMLVSGSNYYNFLIIEMFFSPETYKKVSTYLYSGLSFRKLIRQKDESSIPTTMAATIAI